MWISPIFCRPTHCVASCYLYSTRLKMHDYIRYTERTLAMTTLNIVPASLLVVVVVVEAVVVAKD